MTDGRELDVENCTRLGILLTRHILQKVWPGKGIPHLISLSRVRSVKRGEEEVADKQVVGKHLEMLLEIFSAFPHAALAKSSLRQAFDKAGDSVDLSKWSKDGIADDKT